VFLGGRSTLNVTVFDFPLKARSCCVRRTLIGVRIVTGFAGRKGTLWPPRGLSRSDKFERRGHINRGSHNE
jgi:hypothetical protein